MLTYSIYMYIYVGSGKVHQYSTVTEIGEAVIGSAAFTTELCHAGTC